MSQLKAKLDQLEIRLQSLIEGSAARLFPEVYSQDELAHDLVSAMKERIRRDADGAIIAPNLYIITTHSRLGGNTADPFAEEELAEKIRLAGIEEGFTFLEPPRIQFIKDDSIPYTRVDITARFQLQELAQTAAVADEPEAGEMDIPDSAFLIVNGTRIYNLTSAVVNIGRRPDNHIVIDDSRVSRLHAQLRAIEGRYVLFDLDSTGGTFINDERIHQSIIFPGDVISLGGLPLVFGQDEPGIDQTQQITPPAEDNL